MSVLSSAPTIGLSKSTTWGRKVVHSLLKKLRGGELVFEDAAGVTTFGERIPGEAPVRVTIHSAEFYRRLIFQGGIGVAESYMEGLWETPQLTRLLQLMVRNGEIQRGIDGSSAKLFAWMQRGLHRLRSNTRQGSRKNIAAHYDLSNDFFQLFLDPSMMYSAAIFENEAELANADPETLERASIRKLDTVCRKLNLVPTDHLLEIGTGWGSMAIHAAKHYGCKVTTTTISKRQYELARERIRQEGLEDKIELLLEDYRDLQGQYDKIVSIEMIEAIGAEYFETFFRQCDRLLAEDGLMLLQSITIADRAYDRARRSVDFIKKYIFPGCCIPSVGALTQSITQHTNMDVLDSDDIGPHYATTLRCWLKSFQKNESQIRSLGFDDRFMRMWEYYLCYCEAGFAERQLRDFQFLLAKPENRRLPLQLEAL